MTVVGRPPILRVGHKRIEILFQSIEVEALELLSVVEILVHGIRKARMLVKDIQFQLVRPPVSVRGATASYLFARSARDRTLVLVIHKVSSSFSITVFIAHMSITQSIILSNVSIDFSNNWET